MALSSSAQQLLEPLVYCCPAVLKRLEAGKIARQRRSLEAEAVCENRDCHTRPQFNLSDNGQLPVGESARSESGIPNLRAPTIGWAGRTRQKRPWQRAWR